MKTKNLDKEFKNLLGNKKYPKGFPKYFYLFDEVNDCVWLNKKMFGKDWVMAIATNKILNADYALNDILFEIDNSKKGYKDFLEMFQTSYKKSMEEYNSKVSVTDRNILNFLFLNFEKLISENLIMYYFKLLQSTIKDMKLQIEEEKDWSSSSFFVYLQHYMSNLTSKIVNETDKSFGNLEKVLFMQCSISLNLLDFQKILEN